MQNLPPHSRTLTTPRGPVTVPIVPEPEPELSIQVTYLAAEPDNTPERSEVFSPREMALIFQQPPGAPEQHSRMMSRAAAIAASLLIACILWPTNHTPRSADADIAPATQPSSAVNGPTPTTQPAP